MLAYSCAFPIARMWGCGAGSFGDSDERRRLRTDAPPSLSSMRGTYGRAMPSDDVEHYLRAHRGNFQRAHVGGGAPVHLDEATELRNDILMLMCAPEYESRAPLVFSLGRDDVRSCDAFVQQQPAVQGRLLYSTQVTKIRHEVRVYAFETSQGAVFLTNDPEIYKYCTSDGWVVPWEPTDSGRAVTLDVCACKYPGVTGLSQYDMERMQVLPHVRLATFFPTHTQLDQLCSAYKEQQELSTRVQAVSSTGERTNDRMYMAALWGDAETSPGRLQIGRVLVNVSEQWPVLFELLCHECVQRKLSRTLANKVNQYIRLVAE